MTAISVAGAVPDATPSGARLAELTEPTDLAVMDQQILPAYQQFADVTHALQQQSRRFCAAPDQAGLTQLQSAYLRSLDAWQRSQTIRFGPVDFALRLQRIQLWPDKRGSVGKHLKRLLAAQSAAALEPDNFARGSVAVQGLSAMERLLYDKQTSAARFAGDPANAYRCALLIAIGDNLSRIATGIIDDWLHNDTAYRQAIATAASGNDFFENRAEVDSKLLNALHTQLQIIVDQKLDRPLGKTLQTARGKRAENWRSAHSLNNIQTNLAAARQFYRLAFATRLSDPSLDQRIETAFTRSLAAAADITLPLAQAVASAEQRPTVLALRQQASALKALIGQQLPQATGIPLGFNSLDGD